MNTLSKHIEILPLLSCIMKQHFKSLDAKQFQHMNNNTYLIIYDYNVKPLKNKFARETKQHLLKLF